MTKETFDHDEFEEELALHEDLIGSVPLNNADLIMSIERLERTGLSLVGTDQLNLERFHAVMHRVLGTALTLDVQPPLSEGRKAIIQGKYATYGYAVESSMPRREPARIDPTPTSSIPTSQAKR